MATHPREPREKSKTKGGDVVTLREECWGGGSLASQRTPSHFFGQVPHPGRASLIDGRIDKDRDEATFDKEMAIKDHKLNGTRTASLHVQLSVHMRAELALNH